MENQKKLIILLGVFFTLIVFLVAIIFFRLGAKKNELLENNGNFSTGSTEQKTVVDKIESIPSMVTGTIESINADKIIIKQFANFDLNYEIKKSDVASVALYQKNPDFDQAKRDAKQQELEDRLKAQGTNMNQPPLPAGSTDANTPQNQQQQAEIQKVMDEFNQAMESDPTLKETIEKPIDFSEIKIGTQINLIKDEKGANKLVVYPSDMNIGPPR